MQRFTMWQFQLPPPVSPFLIRINDLPVLLHIDHCPTFRLCFVEALVEAAYAGLAIVGPFVLGIGVVDI